MSEQQIASIEQGRRPLKPDLAEGLDDDEVEQLVATTRSPKLPDN
ncbi:hypothetical protein [Streptomyces spinoverrucosus]